jgi:hypothetical protein
MNNADRTKRFAAYVKQEQFVDELIAAASLVIDRWGNGDLAEAVRRLDNALASLLYASGLNDMEDGHE